MATRHRSRSGKYEKADNQPIYQHTLHLSDTDSDGNDSSDVSDDEGSTLEPIEIEHNYVGNHKCHHVLNVDSCQNCGVDLSRIKFGSKIKRDSWLCGRRIVEFGVLLDNLTTCVGCHLGPIPLLITNIVGEMICGLGGYLYVMCQNPDCLKINIVPYGKLHKNPASKINKESCFVVNTKLGEGMCELCIYTFRSCNKFSL